MKKTFDFAAAAALLMASSAAQAGDGFSFSIDGQKMRIEAPRNCNSLSCISVTKNGSTIDMKNMNLKGRNSDDDNVATSLPPPASLPQPAPLPTAANNAPPAPAPAADTDSERLTGLPSTPPPRSNTVGDQPDRLKRSDEAAAPVANAAPLVRPAPAVQEAAAAATTPIGLWQTEDNKGNNKGNVRVEQCGANLCGYGETNGEKSKELVLINMKPSSDNSKWTGRIHDPSSGKDYDSTIAMAGPNQLKVQGCALGGMFCGGTTWKRIN
jgi:uncharacterized protein (DUF2147 family)